MIKVFAEFAYGVLHWSPSDFWCSTPWDLYRAMTGWRKVNGVASGKTLTPEKIKQLKELAEMHKRMDKKNGKT